MNKNLLAGIEELIKGLTMMAEAIKAGEDSAEEEAPTGKKAPASKKAAEKKTPAKTATKSAPAKDQDEDETEDGEEYTYAQLQDMKYNDLKKYSSSIGGKGMGTRKEIINSILAIYGAEAPEEDDTEEDEAPAPKKTSAKNAEKKAPAGKKAPASKKAAPVEEDEEEDETALAVQEAVEDMDDKEIAELLKEAGIPCKGKRDVLIKRLIQGVKDEVIDFGDEEDEAEDGSDTEDGEGDVYDSLNDYENNDEITKERVSALKKFEAGVNKKIKAKTLKVPMMKKALKQYYGDEIDLDGAEDEEVVSAYIDMKERYIDDDGENYDGVEEAYYVNGMLACHGFICEESEDGTSLCCSVCGAEYEV